MTPWLVPLLCDPETREPLTLENAHHDSCGDIESGTLRSPSGRCYPVTNGIPRFVDRDMKASVDSFGDEWNYFNFVQFKSHWQGHTVANTFGSIEAFRDKVIVDAGGGSGAQTLWMLESGARHVVMLELSHSVDDVVQRNLRPSGYRNFDVVQCSIDAPPVRPRSIDGIVICHNVIQHTPSVEKTARVLFDLVAEGGEFVFNCYQLNDTSPLRWVRFHAIYRPLRAILSKLPFAVTLTYARAVALLRMVPGIGTVLEKSGVCVRGDVPHINGETTLARLRRGSRAAVLNTFDNYGSHTFQHHKSDDEIRALIRSLQPDPSMIGNTDRYFARPHAIGCALRIRR